MHKPAHNPFVGSAQQAARALRPNQTQSQASPDRIATENAAHLRRIASWGWARTIARDVDGLTAAGFDPDHTYAQRLIVAWRCTREASLLLGARDEAELLHEMAPRANEDGAAYLSDYTDTPATASVWWHPVEKRKSGRTTRPTYRATSHFREMERVPEAYCRRAWVRCPSYEPNPDPDARRQYVVPHPHEQPLRPGMTLQPPATPPIAFEARDSPDDRYAAAVEHPMYDPATNDEAIKSWTTGMLMVAHDLGVAEDIEQAFAVEQMLPDPCVAPTGLRFVRALWPSPEEIMAFEAGLLETITGMLTGQSTHAVREHFSKQLRLNRYELDGLIKAAKRAIFEGYRSDPEDERVLMVARLERMYEDARETMDMRSQIQIQKQLAIVLGLSQVAKDAEFDDLMRIISDVSASRKDRLLEAPQTHRELSEAEQVARLAAPGEPILDADFSVQDD